jgi:hypothetical protein
MRLEGWVIAVVVFVVGIVSLQHLGVNSGLEIASSLHAVERALGQPI